MGQGRRSGPTIRDVAAEAGVSKSLVSMVFNDDPRVSDVRRKLVLDAAQRLGFSPNWMARSLAAGDGDFVGVMVPDLANPIFAEILEGIRAELRGAGQRTLVSSALFTDAGGNREFDDRVLPVLRDMHPSSLVVIGSVPSLDIVQPLMERIPTVVASGTADDLEHVYVVRNDDVIGIDLIVDHLVERGHRRIAHVGGAGGGAAVNRRDAYEGAMHRHRLAEHIEVELSDYTTERAIEVTRRLLTRSPGDPGGRAGAVGDAAVRNAAPTAAGTGAAIGTQALHPDDVRPSAIENLTLRPAGERPTAIVAVNDLAALGVITAVEQLGLRVPEDIAVTGYDDTALSGIDRISLTTVDPRNEEISHETVRLLLDADGPFEGHRERLVIPRLVVRGSTAA
ncbi:LacI family transcriptional regulator [Pseudoclavibacter sp. CFCC 14310]|uniref:LacI family DNA-binding transcriptional regulator n=1 Tax=Pseudoclavibacter sp. CFCC 14310 TaxID=2615180 RepID=UPI00130186FE|nr:LacI family DNA-binding transcriptional regulator [Pseudoclavibacter sp. CFCC 14310]KAB1644339.1 LacI family transcriptional regulator [Pseudoclavibacter sp. CFCC 14310]